MPKELLVQHGTQRMENPLTLRKWCDGYSEPSLAALTQARLSFGAGLRSVIARRGGCSFHPNEAISDHHSRGSLRRLTKGQGPRAGLFAMTRT